MSTDETELDKTLRMMQKKIDAEEEKEFSKEVIREYRKPQNVGRMKNPDGFGIVTGSCGDTMEFYLRVENRRIKKITFMTDGCGPSIACGSITTKLVKAKTIDKALKITNQDILDALKGLPEENEHCAKMAADTLNKAIHHYLDKKVIM